MARTSYLLHQDLVINSIHQFFAENDHGFYRILSIRDDKEYQVKLCDDESRIDARKAAGILTVFFAKGHTSFLIQGNPGYRDVLKECETYIVKSTELGDIQKENKCAVFKDISLSTFNDFIDLLQTENSLKVSRRPGIEPINEYISIEGRYETSVTVTYFQNETVTIQGLVTTLLIEVFNLSIQLFGAEDSSADSGFLTAIKAPGHEIISESLDDHFPDKSKFANTRLDALILSSIKMLNSNISIPDFSPMSSGALRALEGMIGMRLHADIEFNNDKEVIGSRFLEDPTTKEWRLTTTHISSVPLISALQDGYRFYRDKRHSSFHAQFRNPMATIVYPKKEQALGVVEECIRLINRIINNW